MRSTAVVMAMLLSLSFASEPFELDTIYDDGEALDDSSEEDRDGRSIGFFSRFPFSLHGSRRAAHFSQGATFIQHHPVKPQGQIPLYSDAGQSTGITKPLLEANYYSQRHKALLTPTLISAATLNAPQVTRHNPGSSGGLHNPVNDRRPPVSPVGPPPPSAYSSKLSSQRISVQGSSPSSGATPVALESGFIPIVNGKAKRLSSQKDSHKVLHQIAAPILGPVNISAPQPSRHEPFLLSEATGASSAVYSRPQPPAPLLTVPPQKLLKNRETSIYVNSKKHKQETPQYFAPQKVVSYSSSVSSRVVSDPVGKDSLLTSASAGQISKSYAKKSSDLDCDGSKDLGWCDLADKYPRELVQEILVQCGDLVERMFVEVPHNFEKLSDSSNYRSQLDNESSSRDARERGNHESWSWAAYQHQGSLCDAERGFLRPEAARDSTGKWNLIVQAEDVRQRIPIEVCRKTNGPCKRMSDCGLKSQCLQKYNYHLLLSVDPDELDSCPTMKLYRFPSACVCHAA